MSHTPSDLGGVFFARKRLKKKHRPKSVMFLVDKLQYYSFALQ
jgi:hypothetical protein